MKTKDVARQKDFVPGRKPKVLCLDLEISPMLAYTYEAYDSNVLKILRDPKIVAFSCSWNGSKRIITRVLPDYPGYEPGIMKLDDRKIVEELHGIMEQADMIYGHNVKDFDIKHAKARFIYHGLPVSKKWYIEDTLKMARKYFRFPKNNLDFLTESFGIGTKTDIRHSDVIWGCIDGDERRWKQMKRYVARDITISIGLFAKLSPWHETMGNLNLVMRGRPKCRVCLANGRPGTYVVRNGTTPRTTFSLQKWQCQEPDCLHQWNGEVIARSPRREPPEQEIEPVLQRNP